VDIPIAFPIRLRGGYLQQCDEAGALLSLLHVMASTPQGSWAGCPQFGLRDLLEQSRTRPEKVQAALAELNRALELLRIQHYRAASIVCESAPGDQVGRWVVTLESVDNPGRTCSLRWAGHAD
jgi:hypothetical protein